MGASFAIARAQLRRRWRALLALAVLIGVGAGASIALVAGARRSSDVVARFRDDRVVADIIVQPDEVDAERLAELRAEPSVASAAPYAVVFASVAGSGVDPLHDSETRAAVDGTYGRVLDLPVIVEGSPLDHRDPNAVQISEKVARENDLEIGDIVVVETLSAKQITKAIFAGAATGDPAGPRLELTVTSIVRPVEEVLSRFESRSILLTEALWEQLGDPISFDQEPVERERIGGFTNILFARSRPGRVDAAAEAAREIFKDDEELFVEHAEDQSAGIRDLTRVVSIALAVGAIAVAVAAAVVGSQAINRHLADAGGDTAALRSMGLTRRERASGLVMPLAAVAIGAAVVGLATAVALSARFPISELRPVEPDPGVRIDAPVLAAGVAALLVVSIGAAIVGATRVQRPVRSSTTRSVRRAIGRGPVVPSVAMRLATGRGIPVRPALGGAVVALAGVAAVATFTASLSRFVDDPERDGWAFDAEVGLADDLDDDAAVEAAEVLASNRAIDGMLFARVGALDVGPAGDDTPVFGLHAIEGDVGLTMLEGRLPATDGEVAIGADTARDNETGVGRDITISGADGDTRLRVTGIARFPVINSENPADGLAMTLAALAAIAPSTADETFGFPTTFATWAEGVTTREARRELPPGQFIGSRLRSTDAVNLERIRGLPPLLASGLLLLGAAAVAHALVVAARRQRRDLALLRTIGFRRSQVRRVLVLQSLGYGLLGLLAGVPLGLIIGRWSWRALADELGAASDPLTPAVVALAVPATLVFVAVVAALPAWAAARHRVADDLRDE